jgi:hypothetical protein
VDRPKAESLGLIVAELAINSLKHALVDVAKGGLIVMAFDAVETEWTLSVSDNGGGKQKHAIVAEGGLGTGIVEALARQLNALIVTKSGPKAPPFQLLITRWKIDRPASTIKGRDWSDTGCCPNSLSRSGNRTDCAEPMFLESLGNRRPGVMYPYHIR